MHTTLTGVASKLDCIAQFSGKISAWLCIAMALAMGAVVIMRYLLDAGSVALQELVTYLHAGIFMLGAALTLQRGGHVRVDIFYRRFSRRTRAWIDSVGAIVFLMPMCVFIAWVSWNYVLRSWAVAETSSDPGGLPAVFLLKSLIPLMAASLLVQGLAEILRNLAILGEIQPDKEL